MSKVNEVLLHITTDLTYVSQDSLNSDEDIINFQNGILKITATDTELILHSADILFYDSKQHIIGIKPVTSTFVYIFQKPLFTIVPD